MIIKKSKVITSTEELDTFYKQSDRTIIMKRVVKGLYDRPTHKQKIDLRHAIEIFLLDNGILNRHHFLSDEILHIVQKHHRTWYQDL